MARSIFKDEEYFSNYIKELKSILNKDITEYNLDQKNLDERKVRESKMYERIFIASYSYGNTIEELRPLYQKAVNSVCNSWTREIVNFKMGREQKIFDQLYVYHHASVFRLLSIGVLLESKAEIEAIKTLLGELKVKNRLFDMLIQSIAPTHELTSIAESYSPTAFNKIEKIAFESPIDEKKLIKNHRTWYSTLNKNYFQWKDSHLNKGFGFYGYWNFEVAALAKISGANVSKLFDDVFFPTDLYLESDQIHDYPIPKGFKLLFAIDSLIAELGGVRRSTNEILAVRKGILQYKKLNPDELKQEIDKFKNWVKTRYAHEIAREKLDNLIRQMDFELEQLEK